MNPTDTITKQIIPNNWSEEERTLLISSGGVSPPPQSGAGAETAPLHRRRWLKMATSDIDRAGDILLLDGMDATNFLKNPQFLWQHGKSGAQVNTIGKVIDLRVTDGRVVGGVPAAQSPNKPATQSLLALAEYAPADINPLAEQIYQLDLLGLLPANSIGFRPIEWEANEFGGHTFTKWELIECSKVELPMNPAAVDRAVVESGKWIEDSVDMNGRVIDPDRDLLPFSEHPASPTSIDDATDWLNS